ncbi:hypothetical protein LIER_21935 [Lithospermum erythrorhizon]|uniref:Transposase n=1 Tax=Lithospermum erythrorhizon TaxID=34254 RepID=A0AAV3QS70_LITER
MAGHVRENHPDQNDEAFKVAYGESRSMFSVRLHYNGRFVGNPNMSYEGDPEEEGFNRLRPLKSPKNIFQFVNMTSEHKFIDVYFVRSGNTNGLDDLEDINDNLKISMESVERLKALSIERDNKLSAIEFHLDNDNCDGVVDEAVGGAADDVVGQDGQENEGAILDEDEENDSSKDGSSEDEVDILDVEDVLYGHDHDGFDVGDLEDNHEDDINSPNLEKSSGEKSGKRKKQPVLTRFEKSVTDGDVEPETQGQKMRYKGPYVRHGVRFKEMRESGWIEGEESEESDDVLGDKICDSDFDSGDTTSDSDEKSNVLRLTVMLDRRGEYEDIPEDVNVGLFKRIYICLRPLIEDFKVGYKKLIGLDGCHTKGIHKQQILSAVALDPKQWLKKKTRKSENGLYKLLQRSSQL